MGSVLDIGTESFTTATCFFYCVVYGHYKIAGIKKRVTQS